MTSSKIRYKHIHKLVNDIYLNQNIHSFPIDLNKIISSLKNYRIKILSYSTVMNKYDLTEEEVFSMLTSKDGCTVYGKGKHIIYYNDLDSTYPLGRIKWTIAHELGHILCGHFKNDKTNMLKEDGLSDEEYELMEKEANHFASLLLSHSAVLSKIKVKSSKEIESFCGLSGKASKNTLKNLKTWNRYNFSIYSDKYILSNFKDYIDERLNDYKEHLAFINAFKLR